MAAAPAGAVERLEGYFIAFEECEAFQSKNKETNPGGIVTEPFRAYEMIALNAPGGDFFQVRMPGAPVTEDRWVHVGCGLHVVAAGTEVAPLPDEPVEPSAGRGGGRARAGAELAAGVLRVPAGEGRVPRPQRRRPAGDRDASCRCTGCGRSRRGTLYCGVPAGLVALDEASRWADLPEVALDDETREALAVAMPGTASFLERHEWIKHGTCHRGAGEADEYYDDSLRLVDAINAGGRGAVRRARRGRDRRRRAAAGVRRRLRAGRRRRGCRCAAPATAAGRWCRSSGSPPPGWSGRTATSGRCCSRGAGVSRLPARGDRPGGPAVAGRRRRGPEAAPVAIGWADRASAGLGRSGEARRGRLRDSSAIAPSRAGWQGSIQR